MGDIVNTASRAAGCRAAGELVVGHETYLLTRNAIRYESLTSIEAKGKAGPVELWRALELLAAAPERPKTPMVGRDREMDLLSSIWDRAVTDRRPHLVTVVGPPGIGKSRLQREFSAHVHARAGRVARGRCLPYGSAGYTPSFS
jgi:hypothetical protein